MVCNTYDTFLKTCVHFISVAVLSHGCMALLLRGRIPAKRQCALYSHGANVATDALGVSSLGVRRSKSSGHDLRRRRTGLLSLAVDRRPRHSGAVSTVLFAHLARLAAKVRSSPSVQAKFWTSSVTVSVPALVAKRNGRKRCRTVLSLGSLAVCSTLALDERRSHFVPKFRQLSRRERSSVSS